MSSKPTCEATSSGTHRRRLWKPAWEMRYICVKSAAHFRSGFEAIAGSIYNIDAAGLHTFDLRKLTFRKARAPFFGIDRLD